MHLQNSLRWIAMVCVSAGGVLAMMQAPASAQGFEQAEIEDPNLIRLAASPAGQVGYQLLIVEQLSDERPCWEDRAGSIQPLLLEFDFSGICRRILDSNGYSLRMGNRDLGLDYTLRVVPKGDHLVLVASSTKDYFAPPIELGRSVPGQASGFASIYLAPGWRLTRRAFEGQTLGHYYITNDMDVESYMSIAVLSDDVLVAPSTYTFPATPPAPVAPPVTPGLLLDGSDDLSPQLLPSPAPEPQMPLSPVPTTVMPTITAPEPPALLSPEVAAPTIQPAVPAAPTAVPAAPTAVPAAPSQPSLAAPPPANSPIPAVEASPITIPPLAPLPEAGAAPLLVPMPPVVSDESGADTNAAAEPSPWIQFNRQPADVQTF